MNEFARSAGHHGFIGGGIVDFVTAVVDAYFRVSVLFGLFDLLRGDLLNFEVLLKAHDEVVFSQVFGLVLRDLLDLFVVQSRVGVFDVAEVGLVGGFVVVLVAAEAVGVLAQGVGVLLFVLEDLWV